MHEELKQHWRKYNLQVQIYRANQKMNQMIIPIDCTRLNEDYH